MERIKQIIRVNDKEILIKINGINQTREGKNQALNYETTFRLKGWYLKHFKRRNQKREFYNETPNNTVINY